MTSALRFSKPAGQIALALADFLIQPWPYLCPKAQERIIGKMPGLDISTLIRSNFATRSIQRYVSDLCGARAIFDAMQPGDTSLEKLPGNVAAQAALRIALAPDETLMHLRVWIAALVCRHEIRSAMLKTDKDAIDALIGSERRSFVMRQADMIYPRLGQSLDAISTSLSAKKGESFAVHPMRDVADQILCEALQHGTDLAAQVYSTRFALDVRLPLGLSEGQMHEVLSLARQEGLV